MAARYCLELDQPAQGFMDSFLLGNGTLGASVHSGIGVERLDINLDTLWSGGPGSLDDTVSPAHLLPTLRAAIRSGDFAAADALSRQMQGSGWTQSYQPLAGVTFGFADPHAAVTATGYRRTLNLAEAVASHRYFADGQSVAITSRVSRPGNIVLTTLEGSDLPPLADMVLNVDCPHPARSESWSQDGIRWLTLLGRAPSNALPPYVDADPGLVYAEDSQDSDGTVAAGMGFALVAALQQTAPGQMRLIIAAECGFRGYDRRPSADLAALLAIARQRVERSLLRDTQAIVADHLADYRKYFARVDLELPPAPGLGHADPAQAELLFHLGRYFLISSSRPGGEPANLQGIWNTYTRPAWSANHTVNINTEMIYWPAEPCDLGELTEPLLRMLDELRQTGRIAARHFYGADGAVLHHNTDIWRFARPVRGTPVWANWTSGLAWLSAHAWDRLAYRPAGPGPLEDRLYPLLADVTRFILSMQVSDPQGQWITSPSSSPENAFLDDAERPFGVTEGASMDQELAHEVLTRFVAIAKKLDRPDADLVTKAEARLADLHLPAIDADGRLQEWSAPFRAAEAGHRHMSHLYGIYPGQRISELGTPDLYQAARQALAFRLENGSGHTGWSQAWLLCLAARFRDGALAGKAIAELLGKLTTSSLLVLHPYEGMPQNAVFQIDGNMGATAGIVDMLVQPQADAIALLAALPDHWHQGRLEGIRAPGGHRLSLAWSENRLDWASLEAGDAGCITLDLPGNSGPWLVRSDDGAEIAPQQAPAANGRQRIVWQARAAVLYRIVRAAHEPASAQT